MNVTGLHVDEPKIYPVEAINPKARACGREWSHFWCDPGHEEFLHAAAAELKLERRWFQDKIGFPHYDLTRGKYWQAIRRGVPKTDLADWLRQQKLLVAQMRTSIEIDEIIDLLQTYGALQGGADTL